MNFDTNKVLTFKDIETAETLLGKKVYLGDSLDIIKKFIVCKKEPDILKSICSIKEFPFKRDDKQVFFRYCYPYEEPQKKLEPFTWEDRELLRGKWVRMKDKIFKNYEFPILELDKSSTPNSSFLFVKIDERTYSAKEVLEKFEFTDGSPIGKEIEE